MELDSPDLNGDPGGPVRVSFLLWLFRALGLRFSFLIPATALLAFALVLVLVLRGKDKTIGPCLVLIVPLPFLVGIFAMLDGLLASFQVISNSAITPKPTEIYEGLAMSFVAPYVGALSALPAYFTAVIGLLIRTLGPERSMTPLK